MSVKSMNWAFEQRGISDGCARLLLVIADYADDEGLAWPARSKLAAKTEKSRDTVDRRVAELVDGDVMCVQARSYTNGDGKKITQSNAYQLHLKGKDNCAHCSRKSAAPPGRISAAQSDEDDQRESDAAPGRTSAAGSGRKSAPSREDAAGGAAPAAAPPAASVAAPIESVIEPSVNHTRTMPIGGGNFDPEWSLSDDDRAIAIERGYAHAEADEVFGQFLDHCATKGPRLSASWRSEWRKWVRNQVRFDTQRAPRSRAAPQTQEASHVIRADNFRPLNAAEREQTFAGDRRASWSTVLGAIGAAADVSVGAGGGGDERGAGSGADLFADDPRRVEAGGS